MKLVFTMFNNMIHIFQAPLTITVALIMLFIQNKTYGFIGLYWFIISFLLHRELDQKMTHCNATKLALIDKRSEINYQMLFQMKQARIIGWQDVMIQKNNDLFQQQNHDHYLFYFYNTLYDIILLMLPVLVVVTICIWDMGASKHITVEQVYLMLSLLGICYEPMKSFRTISISFHDGLHSLHRFQQYFNMPEQEVDTNFVSNKIAQGNLVIQKQTASAYPGAIFDFFVKTKFHRQVKPGQRFSLIGRKGQGRTAFLNMINGFMQKIQGSIKINGKKAALTQNFFFLKTSVRNNIIFYNDNQSNQYLQKLSSDLIIGQQLTKTGGLQTIMDDINKFSKSLLQRISLARVLCSDAKIYVLDRPFQYLEDNYQYRVEKFLRKKQQNNRVMIIMATSQINFQEDNDWVGIIENGVVKDYNKYWELIQNPNSRIVNYFKSKQQKQFQMSPLRKGASPLNLKNKFKKAVHKITAMNSLKKIIDHGPTSSQLGVPDLSKNPSSQLQKLKSSGSMFASLFNPTIPILPSSDPQQKYTFFKLFKMYISSVPIIQILFIMIIIACAQLMHVFIHFFIGHMEQEHGGSGYYKFRNMMMLQVVLTVGLAGVLYYEGDVSSNIAIIQGNTLYKKSLFSLINKKISCFLSQYPVKIADKFNHDYQQIFIACHSLLTIYKNFIILLGTVIFISSDGYTSVALVYTAIYLIIRKVQKKVTAHFYTHKYGFVKCFEQSLGGAQYFHIFGREKQLIKRAQYKYRRLASYKLAEKNTNHGLMIACDLIGNILLALIVYYGLQAKVHHSLSNMALIATSIHLLMNGSQVLKNILKETIHFQTFFRINLVPFLQIIDEYQDHYMDKKNCQRPQGHQISFQSIILSQPGQMRPRPLTLTIPQGQHILLYQPNQSFRNLLLYSLTKNLQSTHQNLYKSSQEIGTVEIGNVDIHRIHPQQLFKIVGVIMNCNFYFTGTLRENLGRKIRIDQGEVREFVAAQDWG